VDPGAAARRRPAGAAHGGHRPHGCARAGAGDGARMGRRPGRAGARAEREPAGSGAPAHAGRRPLLLRRCRRGVRRRWRAARRSIDGGVGEGWDAARAARRAGSGVGAPGGAGRGVMAVVRPFRALRYDAAHVGDLGAVVAPPYDVISAAQQDALYARSPWNVVRLIPPRQRERAPAAGATLSAWIDSGVLALDPEPALYFYSQEFSLSDGTRHRRDGVLCRLGLEEFATGVVRPHERTFPGPKADQLALLRATGAYLS